MTAYTVAIFLTILQMLSANGARPETLANSYCHLSEVAAAVDAFDHRHGAEWFLSIALVESKFDYRNPDEVIVSGSNACGIYQQVPEHAAVEDLTCQELRNPWIATAVAAAKFDRMTARSGPLGEGSICHYCGWTCDPNPPDPSLQESNPDLWEREDQEHRCYLYGQNRIDHAARTRRRIDRNLSALTPNHLAYWSSNLQAACQDRWVYSNREMAMIMTFKALFGHRSAI